MTASSLLRVARDPALAMVVRIFVGAVTERWDVPEATRDDLRLAASELFSGAVEAGDGEDVTFTLARESDAVTLTARGVDAPDGDPGDEGAWGGRLQLVRALFPGTEVGDLVLIAVPMGAGAAP